MSQYILSAFVLGYVVTIPPGAVTITGGQYALQYGFRKVLFFTIGSCLSDIFYITIVYIGIAELISENIFMKITLYCVSTALLLFIGTRTITRPVIPANSAPTHGSDTVSSLYLLLSGITITLFNPVTIVGWLAVAGNFFLLWQNRYEPSIIHGSISIISIMCGAILWFVPLMFIISKLHKLLNNRSIKAVIIISGLLLAGLGLLTGYRLMILLLTL